MKHFKMIIVLLLFSIAADCSTSLAMDNVRAPRGNGHHSPKRNYGSGNEHHSKRNYGSDRLHSKKINQAQVPVPNQAQVPVPGEGPIPGPSKGIPVTLEAATATVLQAMAIKSQIGCDFMGLENATQLVHTSHSFITSSAVDRAACNAAGDNCSHLEFFILIEDETGNYPFEGTVKFALDDNAIQFMYNIKDRTQCIVRVSFVPNDDNLNLPFLAVTTSFYGPRDFNDPSMVDALRKELPNIAQAVDRAHEKCAPILGFFGPARVTPKQTAILKASAEEITAIILPTSNYWAIGGGFNKGVTEVSYEIGKEQGDGSLVAMPMAGLGTRVPVTDEFIGVYGYSWGDDSPALTFFADYAVAIAPFGEWTEVELANLLHVGRPVVILTVDWKGEWWVNSYMRTASGDPCFLNNTVCYYTVQGRTVPAYRDPTDAANYLQKQIAWQMNDVCVPEPDKKTDGHRSKKNYGNGHHPKKNYGNRHHSKRNYGNGHHSKEKSHIRQINIY